jgi:hypothetical protein
MLATDDLKLVVELLGGVRGLFVSLPLFFVHGLGSKVTEQNMEVGGAYGGDEEANRDGLLCTRHCCGYISVAVGVVDVMLLPLLRSLGCRMSRYVFDGRRFIRDGSRRCVVGE